MENILQYLEYGFPAIAIVAVVVVFLVDRAKHTKIAIVSLFIAFICILVPEIVRFYKKADNTVANLANQTFVTTSQNSEEIIELKVENKEIKDIIKSLQEQVITNTNKIDPIIIDVNNLKSK
jgi:phosphoglycerol transferase MdoB-like AlkP superfamily enzyme